MKARFSFIFFLLYVLFLPKCFGQAQASTLSISDPMLFEYVFISALQNKYSGNLNKAFELLSTCRKLQPHNAAVYYELSLLMTSTQHNDYAAEFANICVSLDTTDNVSYIDLAINANIRVKNVDRVLSLYDKLISVEPDIIDHYFDKYRSLCALGLYKESLDVLECIPFKDVSVSFEIELLRAEAYLKLDNKRKSLKILNGLYKKNPLSPRVNIALSDHYFQNGDYEKALNYCVSVAESENGDFYLPALADIYTVLKMDSLFASSMIKFFSSEVLPLEGKLRRFYDIMSVDDERTVVTSWRPFYDSIIDVMLNMYPSSGDVCSIIDGFYCHNGQDTLGLPILSQFVENNPVGDEYIWRRLLFGSKNFPNTKLIEYSRRAISDMPDFPLFYVANSQFLYVDGESLEALSVAKKGFKMLSDGDPNNSQIARLKNMFLHVIASCYVDLDSLDHAFAYFEQIINDTPDDIVALNNYSYNLALKGLKLDEAEKMSMRTLSIEPLNSTYLDTYAYILFRRGKYSEALFVMERCMENAKNATFEEYDHYGDILYFLGRVDDAVEQWKKALKIAKDKTLIKRKIDEKKYYLE